MFKLFKLKVDESSIITAPENIPEINYSSGMLHVVGAPGDSPRAPSGVPDHPQTHLNVLNKTESRVKIRCCFAGTEKSIRASRRSPRTDLPGLAEQVDRVDREYVWKGRRRRYVIDAWNVIIASPRNRSGSGLVSGMSRLCFTTVLLNSLIFSGFTIYAPTPLIPAN